MQSHVIYIIGNLAKCRDFIPKVINARTPAVTARLRITIFIQKVDFGLGLNIFVILSNVKLVSHLNVTFFYIYIVYNKFVDNTKHFSIHVFVFKLFEVFGR